MIASSILNSITFKNLAGLFPNAWNRLHIDTIQGNNKVIPYAQKFQKDHTVYLQFISDNDVNIELTSYSDNAIIETISKNFDSSYGASNIRYFTNFIIELRSDYYDKEVSFKAIQGGVILQSEPIFTTDLTNDINKGIIKYLKYTNLDRIESDLDDRFIDWSIIQNDGHYMDMFINAVDFEMNDTDENEVLEGSQSMTILSSSYYSGRVLKTGGIPTYLASKLGVMSSLDVFIVNGIQYIKKGEAEQSQLGSSTSVQTSLKLIQKNAVGINVDNLKSSEVVIVSPPAGTQMYIGSVTDGAITESKIKAMTALTASATDQAIEYTFTYKRYCFVYPTSLGEVLSVVDQNGYEIISGFQQSTINITELGTVINYTIMAFIWPLTVSNYTITYKFTA